MKFYLDHDVDARCRAVLIAAGHVCWSTTQAGREDSEDDDQTIYAQEHRAVIITHDSEFTERRKRNVIWKHIRLHCEQPDGPDLLKRTLPDVLAILERYHDVVIELAPQHFYVHHGWS